MAEPESRDVEPRDIASLSYEQARDELLDIVARLEGGQVPLADSMALWERGEALADHCTGWLDRAEAQLSEATTAGGADGRASEPG